MNVSPKSSRANDATEAAARAKREFLANLSHEIRTPLNSILGITNLLLDTPLAPQQQEFAETIRASGDALLTIINDILDFSKIEAGKTTFETLDFDLRALVASVTDLLAGQAQAQKLEFSSQVSPDVPALLHGDPGRVRQVLTHLIGNALKFTQQGAVAVHVTQEQATNSSVVVRFAIRDTGIGISPEGQTQLFQSVSQADASGTRKFGGPGLSLAISKRLVEMLGGQIGVESTPGQGSTFWFTARFEKQSGPARPAAPPPEAGCPPQPQTQDPHQARGFWRGRILVAEDNLINQKVALLWLTKLGYAATAVTTGQAIIEVLEKVPYDLILMDCQMPELDGYAATAEIRRREGPQKHIPIIAMTAYALPGDREKCLAAGMDDYLSKPIQLAVLAAMLSKHMPAVALTFTASIEQLRNDFGNANALEVLTMFLHDTPPRLMELRQLAAGSDRKTLGRAAHTLGGSCSLFGLTELRRLALEIESRAGNGTDSRDLVAELEREFAAVRPRLEQAAAQLQAESNPPVDSPENI